MSTKKERTLTIKIVAEDRFCSSCEYRTQISSNVYFCELFGDDLIRELRLEKCKNAERRED